MARSVMMFIIVFSIGIFAESFLNLSYAFGLFFVFLALVFKLVRLNFNNLYLVLGLVAFGAGIFYYGWRSAPPDLSVLKNRVGQQIQVQGIIVDESDERKNYTRLVLEIEDDVKILLTVNRYPEFRYGDRVEIKGKLQKPSSFDESFDWAAYLAKDDIYFEMFYPEVEFVSPGNGFWIKERLFSFKEKILSKVSRVIPEPHSAFLGGLTFGAKQNMPKDLLEAFRKTGVIHIVVLSGYNVTIVADATMRFFNLFFPQLFGIGLGVLGIIGFAVMAGASATVVRASFMAILVLLARATGRVYQITIALFVAGFLMILHNPKILRFDPSFQLSFLATMALIWVAPMVEPRLKFLPKKFHVREFATATIATQIFVLPLLLYKMGIFSVVSVPVNLLILIFVPATMLFGFLTAAAGFISYFLSLPFGWISYGLLAYELKVVELFSSLPFSSFTIQDFPLWLMLVIYFIYASLIFYEFYKEKF